MTLEDLVSLKHDDAELCSETESCLETLEEEHSIEIGLHISGSARSIKSMDDYHSHVAAPYIDAILANIDAIWLIDAILANIDRRFSDDTIQLLVATSIFNPSLLPSEEIALLNYGMTEIEKLANF